MSEIEVFESSELVLPGTGEVVDTRDEIACAQALDSLRQFENQIRDAKATLTQAIIERAQLLGTKTIHLPQGFKAVVKGGQETIYDAEAIETGLRELGMPEERIREIVKETVEYKVAAVKAKAAAAINPAYARLLEENKRVVEKPQYISIEH